MPFSTRVLRCPGVLYGGELWPRGYSSLEARSSVGDLFFIESPSAWLRDYQVVFASASGHLYRLGSVGQYYGLCLFEFSESRAQILLGHQYEVISAHFDNYEEFLQTFDHLLLFEVASGAS